MASMTVVIWSTSAFGSFPPIDSLAVAGDPNIVGGGVTGSFGQRYYDRPNDDWYLCTDTPTGTTWRLVT